MTKALIKYIIFIVYLSTASYSLELDVSVGGKEVVNTTVNKDDIQKLKYIKSIPTDLCRTFITDENAREDEHGKLFRFMLDNFNHKTGLTKYNVYKQDGFGNIDQDNPVDTISFINEKCVEDVAIELWIDTDAELFAGELQEQGYNKIIDQFQEIRSQDHPNSEFNKKLRALEQRYLKKGGEFTDTGNKKFLTTASYILACLSFDEDIIDIKKSIELNKITLQNEYTIYPHSNAEDTAISDNRNPRSRRASPLDTNSKKQAMEKLHSISEYISENIVLFAFKFRVAVDPVILKIKAILLLIFLPSTLGFLFLSKISKRISEVSDFDDVGEKVVMGLFLFLAFYISDNGNKTVNQFGDESSISINFHQDKTAMLFSGMMGLANETSNIFSGSYINFKRSSAGFSTDTEINAIIKDILELEKMKGLLVTGKPNLITTCEKTYDIDRLKLTFDLKNVTFPTRGQYKYWNENSDMTSPTQFYKGNYNNGNNIPAFTIQMCNQFERDVREIDKALAINKSKLDATSLALDNKYEQDQLLKIARIQFKSSAEMGVIALPQIMATNIVTDNLNMFGSSRNNDKLMTYMKEQSSNEDLNNGNWVPDFIFENLAYMVVPGASTIQEASVGVLNSFSTIASKFFGGFGFIFKKVLNMSSEIVSTMIAVVTMKSLLQYFPVVALSMASLMAITWYFISVFSYFLISPFVIVYVIATQQTDTIKNYMVKGIVLSFKPLLLIMSLLIALIAVYLINDLSIMMFEGNFSLLIDVVSNNNDNISFTGFLMQFFKGLVLVGSSLMGVASAFYLVYNGDTMLLGMLGFKDMGVDVKETIGSSVEAKIGKFNTPGV